MSFELPTFAEMKGEAVAIMNRDSMLLPQEDFPLMFPVEHRIIHGLAAFIINEQCGVIWKRGIPKEMVKMKGDEQPYTEDSWAFAVICMEEPVPGQNLHLFPELLPIVNILSIYSSWSAAIAHCICIASLKARIASHRNSTPPEHENPYIPPDV